VREAVSAFGRGECFVERFLDKPRHVEAQVLADTHGTVIVVGTRDCSLQRRNQKLVEEAPAPFLTSEQRARIHESAKAICKEVGYHGAGTVEYLVGVDGSISFLEVNTRLQVEHPVSEETAGVDLVRQQFRIVEGLPTVVPFHRAVFRDEAFTSEPFTVHTRWIETEWDNQVPPYAATSGEQAEAEPRQTVVVEVGGRRLEISLPAGLAAGGGGA